MIFSNIFLLIIGMGGAEPPAIQTAPGQAAVSTFAVEETGEVVGLRPPASGGSWGLERTIRLREKSVSASSEAVGGETVGLAESVGFGYIEDLFFGLIRLN
jgi:hypothetical protein